MCPYAALMISLAFCDNPSNCIILIIYINKEVDHVYKKFIMNISHNHIEVNYWIYIIKDTL